MGLAERVFSGDDWRDDVDPELANKLEKLLKRTKTYESAYKNARDPAFAQLWVAMAEVFFTMDRFNARLRRIEERQKQIMAEHEDLAIEDEELRESLGNY